MKLKVTVIGGGGYVGSMLVPRLYQAGYEVTVLDTFWYGKDTLLATQARRIIGDVRNRISVNEAIQGANAVIHLACISNDPSFEMNPDLGRSVNYECFPLVLDALQMYKPQRFIYASSSSVYGVKNKKNVTEDEPCEPLTDYSKYKLMCEELLKMAELPSTCWTIIRPATVCGWSPRLRLDLIINALTASGHFTKKIHIHGGNQLRPNINIKDMAQAYIDVLKAPPHRIDREIFNVGDKNLSVMALGKLVAKTLRNPAIELIHEPTIDPRSYHINSDKIHRDIGFRPVHNFEQAISSIMLADHKLRNPMTNPLYYNIKRMKELGLT